jgi:hypothetical protein
MPCDELIYTPLGGDDPVAKRSSPQFNRALAGNDVSDGYPELLLDLAGQVLP